jgi:large subunit ribosomal protein L10
LREADGQFQVVKNTLARRACAEVGNEALLEYLVGQTALVWAKGDPAAVAKAINDFAKKSEDRLSMKGGILDGAPISGEELKQLAALPPRDELLARLVGGIASPLQGTANALNSLLSGMARALGAYHAQRAAEAPAEAAAPAEAPVAEAAPETADAPAAECAARRQSAPAQDAPTTPRRRSAGRRDTKASAARPAPTTSKGVTAGSAAAGCNAATSVDMPRAVAQLGSRQTGEGAARGV